MNTEERADRLGIAMLMFGLVDEPPHEAMEASFPMLSDEAREALRHLTPEDSALSNACLTVERELRARQWAALELLGAALHSPSVATLPPAGTAGTEQGAGAGSGQRMVVVPASVLADTARAVLGWTFGAPDAE